VSKTVNLSGKTFSRLTVLSRTNNDLHGNAQWLCLCECGKEAVVSGTRLIRGIIKSCGCLRRENCIERSTTHGQKKTRLYRIWLNMKNRCNNQKHVREDYRGRGISVCPEWNDDFRSFFNWSIANGYDDTKSIDRIDVNGNYCPKNCRWADRLTQANNTRRSLFLEIRQTKKTLAEWTKITGLNYQSLISKMKRGKIDEVKAMIEQKIDMAELAGKE
jgi:hypothetical protein